AAVSVLGDRPRTAREPGGLCRPDAATTAAALQPKRKPRDRDVLSDALGVAGTLRGAAQSLGQKGKPRSGAGGDPAVERGVDVPSLWRHRRSPDDGICRPGLLA